MTPPTPPLKVPSRNQRRVLFAIPLFLLALLLSCPLLAAKQPASPTPEAPPLLLAETYRPGIDLSLYWVSEKLDGVRARWNGEKLISRGGTEIRHPLWFVEGFPPIQLDGELWMGRGTFEPMSALARMAQPEDVAWRDVRFMVFDLPDAQGTFSQRLQALRQLLIPSPSPYLSLIDQFRVLDHDSLMARLDATLSAGGEGLILHREDTWYRAGRSQDLLKVKPFLDAEARVIGHLPGKGRLEGLLGALVVEEPDGTRFRLGSGFTDDQRRNPPPVGSWITFKYQGRTAKGIPRFASFLRPRPQE